MWGKPVQKLIGHQLPPVPLAIPDLILEIPETSATQIVSASDSDISRPLFQSSLLF